MFFALRFKPFIELYLFIAYQKCFSPHCIATKKTSATGTRSGVASFREVSNFMTKAAGCLLCKHPAAF